LRVGTIRPTTNLECATTITNTGNNLVLPSSSGIFFGGNHRSHCAASPAAQTKRSAGSTGRCSGRSCFTFSLNHRIEPSHPTRSASTVAGMSGVWASRARTRGSITANDVGRGLRSYRGGAAEFTALMTVVREIPNRSAIRVFGTPSPASLLINAQSSKVITLQSLSAHFPPPKLSSFRAPPTDYGENVAHWYLLDHRESITPAAIRVTGTVTNTKWALAGACLATLLAGYTRVGWRAVRASRAR